MKEKSGKDLYNMKVKDKKQNFTDKMQSFNNNQTNIQPKPSYRAENMKTYCDKFLDNDIKSFCEGAKYKTGFKNIDQNTKLYPGVYCVGAISSLGKTTFVHQIADNIAKQITDEQNEAIKNNPEDKEAKGHVMYFSLEQNLLDFATKSVARELFTLHGKQHKDALSASDIKYGVEHMDYYLAVDEYRKYARNISVIEGTFATTLDEITAYIRTFIHKCKIKPVVIVDYIQTIAKSEKRMSTKDHVEECIRALKDLSKEQSIVVFIISSVNRMNYLQRIDFESFKETGGIEFTSDVVWGLQLEAINKSIFDKNNKINEKRETLLKAKSEIPRKIELVCLKNRGGLTTYNCFFDYHPDHDCFFSGHFHKSYHE